jgi:hypothetical protein
MKVLEMPPGPAKVKALRQHEPEFQRVASQVDEMLGNWTRFTARERRYLKRSLLFYGFLRFATKLTFYTLPVKHPVVAGVIEKLGQLENDEVVDLLTGEFLEKNPKGYNRDEIELAIRRELLNQIGGRLYYEHDGKLAYVDAAKISPLAGPLLDFLGDPKKASFGLLSPVLQSTLNGAIGERTAVGSKLNTRGRLTEFGKRSDRGAEELARIIGRDTIRMVPALRALDETLSPSDEVQGDDSLPFLDDRPLAARTEGQVEKLKARAVRRSGDPGTRALRAVIPFIDDDRVTLERINDVVNFPQLDRVQKLLGDMERTARKQGGQPAVDRMKERAEWKELKARESQLSVRGGIRDAPKKKVVRRRDPYGSGGGGYSGAYGPSSGYGG